MPLAFVVPPFRAFPSRGAVPALAGLCFRAGSRSIRSRRGVARRFTIAFTERARPLAVSRPEGRESDAGRRHLDPCDRCPDPFGPRRETNHPERDRSEPSIVSSSSRARRERPARPLRSLAPPGSPFTQPRGPCGDHEAGPVLSWAFLSPELAPVTIQVRSVAVELGDHRFRGDGRWLAPLSRGLRLFPSRQGLHLAPR